MLGQLTRRLPGFLRDAKSHQKVADTRKIKPEQRERLYRIQRQGALVRSGGMIVIWFFAFLAYLYGAIDLRSFKGAGLSIAFIVLMHVPIIPLLKHISNKRLFEFLSFLINVLEIVGYTSFIYFVGGFRSTYLTPIYAAMIFYVGVLAPKRYPFILAGFSSLSFGVMVAMEHFGLIPHQNVIFEYRFEWNIVFLLLLIMGALLFVVAFMSSYAAGIIRSARVKLKEQNAELEKANHRLWQEIEERNYAYQALRENEEKLHDIFENVSDALFSHDLQGNFLETNLGMKRLLGYTDDESLPDRFNIRDLAPERYKSAIDRYLEEVKRKDKSEGTMRVLTKDGSERLAEYKNSLIRNANGTAVGIRGSARDITDKYLAEKEKSRLQEQLQQAKKMEALGTLAGGVAHDLNNILSGIVSYPELLLMEVPENSPFRKPLLTIQKSGEKAASIVQDLLTLARRGVAVSESLDLNTIIREYLKSPGHQKVLSLHPDIEVVTKLEDGLYFTAGSPVHVAKTVMNLVTNAIESMPQGGRVIITTANATLREPVKGFDAFHEGNYLILQVSDTGVGMSEKDRERIFDPFYTKKVMGRSGTGLGLTVVWGTMKDIGGHIDVQSIAGRGSTFTLYFPAGKGACACTDTVSENKDLAGNGEKILVVDDSAEQREIAERMLKRLGYTVVSASSGECAVEYLRKNSTDLVLLDMIMNPGIDGLETYKRILKLYPKQKAIIASGYSETERVREAQKLGAGAYIRKPYLMEKIGKAVKNELERIASRGGKIIHGSS